MIEVVRESKENASNTESKEKCGKISPNAEQLLERSVINPDKQYIVGNCNNLKGHGKILPDAPVKGERDTMGKNCGWFQNPANCVSKWSKALKRGVVHSMGLDSNHTAMTDSEKNDKHSFSFFL